MVKFIKSKKKKNTESNEKILSDALDAGEIEWWMFEGEEVLTMDHDHRLLQFV